MASFFSRCLAPTAAVLLVLGSLVLMAAVHQHMPSAPFLEQPIGPHAAPGPALAEIEATQLQRLNERLEYILNALTSGGEPQPQQQQLQQAKKQQQQPVEASVVTTIRELGGAGTAVVTVRNDGTGNYLTIAQGPSGVRTRPSAMRLTLTAGSGGVFFLRNGPAVLSVDPGGAVTTSSNMREWEQVRLLPCGPGGAKLCISTWINKIMAEVASTSVGVVTEDGQPSAHWHITRIS